MLKTTHQNDSQEWCDGSGFSKLIHLLLLRRAPCIDTGFAPCPRLAHGQSCMEAERLCDFRLLFSAQWGEEGTAKQIFLQHSSQKNQWDQVSHLTQGCSAMAGQEGRTELRVEQGQQLPEELEWSCRACYGEPIGTEASGKIGAGWGLWKQITEVR